MASAKVDEYNFASFDAELLNKKIFVSISLGVKPSALRLGANFLIASFNTAIFFICASVGFTGSCFLASPTKSFIVGIPKPAISSLHILYPFRSSICTISGDASE